MRDFFDFEAAAPPITVCPPYYFPVICGMQKLLVIGTVWPEPASSAAGTRMLQLLALFQKDGYAVTFASAAQDSPFMCDLEALGVTRVPILLNDASFDAFVSDFKPDVVLFDRFMTEEQFGWRVAEHCPNALRVLDTEDLHLLRKARQTAVKENREFSKADLYSDIARREIASIYRCDLSLVISEYEMQLLAEVFKIDASLLFYLPFLADVPSQTNLKSFSDRRDLMFIGNFLHEPNWDAVRHLKTAIWPLVRQQLPDAKLKIYGAYPSQKVLQLHNPKENFLVLGRAEAAATVIAEARVMLAPLRFGAGAKGKLLEAMQCGTPSVTTLVGAESMHGELPWNGSIACADLEFADAAVQLYQDAVLWQTAQQNGLTILAQRYAKNLFDAPFMQRIQTLRERVIQHRRENFFGSLLWQQGFAASKYMALWIAAKNK